MFCNYWFSAQILETHNKVEEKTKIYVPYNILPLDPDSANQAIMQYPEVSILTLFACERCVSWLNHSNGADCILQIRAAVYALRNTRGLPWPKDHKRKTDEDLLDWLQSMFGFQVKNFNKEFFSRYDAVLSEVALWNLLVN